MRSSFVFGVSILALIAVSACSSHPSSVPFPVVAPQVLQSGQPPTKWELFNTNAYSSNAGDLVVGSDGNMWFINCCNPPAIGIANMTMSGVVTLYPLPSGHYPGQMVRGPMSDLWFVESGSNGSIGRMTTSGVLTEYLLPIPNEAADSLALGPDGNIWFFEYQPGYQQQMIGRITRNGKFLPPFNVTGGNAMTTGPDGRVWVTQKDTSIIAITRSGHATTYKGLTSAAYDIISGPDGNLWFAEGAYIGRITTTGTITEFSQPSSLGIYSLAFGPDKHIWFTMEFAQYIGRMSLTGQTQFFHNPNSYQEGGGIAKGPDNNIWFGEAQYLAVYIRLVLSVTPSTISFTGVGQTQTLTVSETKYKGPWTASSLNPAVATVAPASSNTFTVTAVGTGSTSIDVSDSKKNDFLVSVTVP